MARAMSSPHQNTFTEEEQAEAPTSVDWRKAPAYADMKTPNKGAWTGPAKDQGACGSCWCGAFCVPPPPLPLPRCCCSCVATLLLPLSLPPQIPPLSLDTAPSPSGLSAPPAPSKPPSHRRDPRPARRVPFHQKSPSRTFWTAHGISGTTRGALCVVRCGRASSSVACFEVLLFFASYAIGQPLADFVCVLPSNP